MCRDVITLSWNYIKLFGITVLCPAAFLSRASLEGTVARKFFSLSSRDCSLSRKDSQPTLTLKLEMAAWLERGGRCAHCLYCISWILLPFLTTSVPTFLPDVHSAASP